MAFPTATKRTPPSRSVTQLLCRRTQPMSCRSAMSRAASASRFLKSLFAARGESLRSCHELTVELPFSTARCARKLRATFRPLASRPTMTVSVVVPICNELENISPLYHQLAAVLPSLNRAWEIVFVDDGSTDGSSDRLKQLAAAD